MSTITLAQYKSLTGITSTTRDTQISALIPVMVSDFTAYCNQSPPDGSLLVQAQMISYLLSSIAGAGNKSESIEGYSYSRDDLGASGYPPAVEGLLAKFVLVAPKYTQVLTQFRDRRQMTLEQLASDVYVYSVDGAPIE